MSWNFDRGTGQHHLPHRIGRVNGVKLTPRARTEPHLPGRVVGASYPGFLNTPTSTPHSIANIARFYTASPGRVVGASQSAILATPHDDSQSSADKDIIRVQDAFPGRVVGASQLQSPPNSSDQDGGKEVIVSRRVAGVSRPNPLDKSTVNPPPSSTSACHITFGFFDNNEYNEELPAAMSLASKAREAEYNAATAARHRATQFERSTLAAGPSSLRPISLSAFTKPNATTRNKGHKGWKPLTAEDMEGSPSTPAKSDGAGTDLSSDGGVPLSSSDEGKGKQKDLQSRLTHSMLPHLRTNLSPDAPRARLVGRLPPSANMASSYAYDAPHDASGRLTGYREQRAGHSSHRDAMRFDPETGAPVSSHHFHAQAPGYLNADPTAMSLSLPRNFSSSFQSSDFHQSFTAVDEQDQLTLEGHSDSYHYYHQEEAAAEQFAGSFGEDPFMGTPPHHQGQYGFNPYAQEYFSGPPHHETFGYGRQFASPAAGMMMEPFYHHQYQQQVVNEPPMPAQPTQAGRRPSGRPTRSPSRLSNVANVEANPADFDRSIMLPTQAQMAAERSSGTRGATSGLAPTGEATSKPESPLAVLVRSSTVDAAGPSFPPPPAAGVAQPLPGFGTSLRGALAHRVVSSALPASHQPAVSSFLPPVFSHSPPATAGDRLTRLGVVQPPVPAREPFCSRLPAAQVNANNAETFTMRQWEGHQPEAMSAEKWFGVDNRGENEVRQHVEGLARAAREQRRMDRAAAAERSEMPATLAELVASSVEDRIADASTILLGNALATLQAYVAGDRQNQPFARFGPPPEWAIDKSVGANLSFFEDDWGTPPRRVGRDLRYRPLPEDQLPATEEPPVAVRGRRQN